MYNHYIYMFDMRGNIKLLDLASWNILLIITLFVCYVVDYFALSEDLT